MPTEPRSRGATRTYGFQRVLCTILGLVILAAFCDRLVQLATQPLPPRHGPVVLLVALMALLAALPVGILVMSRRLGIHVTDEGVENIAADSKSFTAWSEIERFVIGPAPWCRANSTVHILLRDGRTIALSRFGDWPLWRRRTQSYVDALNRELEYARRAPVDATPTPRA
jgi:hypothetical protein